MIQEDDVSAIVHRPGLIWGFDFLDGETRTIDVADLDSPRRQTGFRWLHLNLSDQRTIRWLTPLLSERMMAFLGASEASQTFLLDHDRLGLVLHDIEREFHDAEPRSAAIFVLAGPTMMITARRHPVRSADLLKHRIDAGARPTTAGEALDLVLACLLEVFREATGELEDKVQDIEDELLKDGSAPGARQFITLRAVMVRLRRLYVGMRSTLRRLEDDAAVPVPYVAAAGRAVARLATLEADLVAVQGQLRLLRDELDLQEAQQTNRNLYVLSILTALLLPATLVTGIFGMNTGGMLWLQDRYGSIWATGLAFGSALLAYLILRFSGFIRR
jgi:Mg2+ and Co2+ transporter CorA